jgi:hypothetical protein
MVGLAISIIPSREAIPISTRQAHKRLRSAVAPYFM